MTAAVHWRSTEELWLSCKLDLADATIVGQRHELRSNAPAAACLISNKRDKTDAASLCLYAVISV